MYKVGDKVRVKSVDSYDVFKGIEVGDEYEVISVYSDGYVTVKKCNFVLYTNQIEKVEESKKMTFPEMVQKLIDGEFEVGTELVTHGKSFWVGTHSGEYGLKDVDKGAFVSAMLRVTEMNATWTVKEQPIKEMSIEELQKKLGYKIKIVERESK